MLSIATNRSSISGSFGNTSRPALASCRSGEFEMNRVRPLLPRRHGWPSGWNTHLATLECIDQRLLVDYATTSGVDQDGSILHLSELFLAKAALGVLVERKIEGDDIGPLEQLLEGRDIFAFK